MFPAFGFQSCVPTIVFVPQSKQPMTAVSSLAKRWVDSIFNDAHNFTHSDKNMAKSLYTVECVNSNTGQSLSMDITFRDHRGVFLQPANMPQSSVSSFTTTIQLESTIDTKKRTQVTDVRQACVRTVFDNVKFKDEESSVEDPEFYPVLCSFFKSFPELERCTFKCTYEAGYNGDVKRSKTLTDWFTRSWSYLLADLMIDTSHHSAFMTVFSEAIMKASLSQRLSGHDEFEFVRAGTGRLIGDDQHHMATYRLSFEKSWFGRQPDKITLAVLDESKTKTEEAYTDLSSLPSEITELFAQQMMAQTKGRIWGLVYMSGADTMFAGCIAHFATPATMKGGDPRFVRHRSEVVSYEKLTRTVHYIKGSRVKYVRHGGQFKKWTDLKRMLSRR